MNTDISEALRKYALEAVSLAEIHPSYYGFLGLLATFLGEVKPFIEAEAPRPVASFDEDEAPETPEEAADRIARAHPEQFILAIKEYRTWAGENEHPNGLKESKDAIEAARLRTGLDTVAFGYHKRTVPSSTTLGLAYQISWWHNRLGDNENFACTCPDWSYRSGYTYGYKCKHIRQVEGTL